MAPQLEQVLTLRAFLGKANTLQLGAVKAGPQRIIIPIDGGFIKGSDLNAEILPGGGDSLLFDAASGTGHLNVRFSARSEAGDMIYGHYPGILKMDAEAGKCLQWSPEARTTESREHYWFATPVFEVSSERLKWIEQSVFVAHGHFYVPGDGRQAVEYEVYRVISA